ncbi:hypothetical protein HPB48_018398 [Haemaphysalis longicornis]|uniref:Uncharacterized protein n=1 Tax=Haemaphysalis longicornis TaxID=44386 RepID=A0A9J6GF01_HAELO|nr:hypothetical protein HPB48_018398 [Haemaphysalis longicornis]
MKQRPASTLFSSHHTYNSTLAHADEPYKFQTTVKLQKGVQCSPCLDNARRSPSQPLDPSRFLRHDERGSRARSERPRSAYGSRDSSPFGYGPGPLGYNVPSPHSRPRSMMQLEDEVERPSGGSTSLRREESLVKKILPRYEMNTGGALRTGPAPVGGVPAIGPASIRRGTCA